MKKIWLQKFTVYFKLNKVKTNQSNQGENFVETINIQDWWDSLLVNQNHDFINRLPGQSWDCRIFGRISDRQEHQKLLVGRSSEELTEGRTAVEWGRSQGHKSSIVNSSDEQS